MRVIVTRPAAQAQAWVDALLNLGVQAQALPLIDIVALDDTTPLHAVWHELHRLSLVMFVSANAVEHFFAARPGDQTWPAGLVAASTGPGTTSALKQAGVMQVVAPPDDAGQFDSEALWTCLQHQAWEGREVLVVRGEEGRDWLADRLRQRGAQVSFVAAYRRRAPTLDPAGRALLAAALDAPQRHLWVFSSSEAVSHLPGLAPDARWSSSGGVASHPRIVQAARDLGFGAVDLVLPDPAALARHVQGGVMATVPTVPTGSTNPGPG